MPHGIDFGTWRIPEDRAALREAQGIGPDTYVIGVNAANNDAIRKAPSEMLLAFAKLLQSRPDSRLLLHTAVHCDGGQDLEFLAESLGITDKITVVDQYRYNAGLIQPSDLADWYGMCDVLLAATYGEGFGLPIVESHGVRHAGYHDEVLEHGGAEPGRAPGGRGAVLQRRPQGVVDQPVGRRGWSRRWSRRTSSAATWTR